MNAREIIGIRELKSCPVVMFIRKKIIKVTVVVIGIIGSRSIDRENRRK